MDARNGSAGVFFFLMPRLLDIPNPNAGPPDMHSVDAVNSLETGLYDPFSSKFSFGEHHFLQLLGSFSGSLSSIGTCSVVYKPIPLTLRPECEFRGFL